MPGNFDWLFHWLLAGKANVLTTVAMEQCALAMLLGFVVGLERSFHGHAAGTRTFALVTLSTALVTLAVHQNQGGGITPIWNLDSTRVIQGLMTGIGFLGGGIILKDGLAVRGLTTAATVWIMAAVGIIVGIGENKLAVFATLLVLLVLSGFRFVDRFLPKHRFMRVTLKFKKGDTPPEESHIQALANKASYEVLEISKEINKNGKYLVYKIKLTTLRRSKGDKELCEQFMSIDDLMEFKAEGSATSD